MIAVIFEVMPHRDRKSDYLDMATLMRPLVDEIDGFISVEKFQSLTNPDKLLSLSFFRDEEAIQDQRRLTKHRAAQSAGRSGMFTDYHLRIAHVVRDYGLFDRDEAPIDSKAEHGQRIRYQLRLSGGPASNSCDAFSNSKRLICGGAQRWLPKIVSRWAMLSRRIKTAALSLNLLR